MYFKRSNPQKNRLREKKLNYCIESSKIDVLHRFQESVSQRYFPAWFREKLDKTKSDVKNSIKKSENSENLPKMIILGMNTITE